MVDILTKMLKHGKKSIQGILKEYGVIDSKKQEELLKKLDQEINIEIKNINKLEQTQQQKQNLISGVPFEAYKEQRDLKDKCEKKLIELEKKFIENKSKARFSKADLDKEYKEYNKYLNENSRGQVQKNEFINKIMGPLFVSGNPTIETFFLKYNITTKNVTGYNKRLNYIQYEFNSREVNLIREFGEE